MSIVLLETAKLHLRVIGTDDDAIVGIYLGAAEEAAAEYVGRAIYADVTAMADDTTGIVINFAITAAILLICGHYYQNREDSVIGMSTAELPNGSKMLLQPYRVDLLV